MTAQMLDQTRLQEFMGKMLNEFSAAATAPLVILGDRLGLFRCLAQEPSATPARLAKLASTAERYTQEWLSAMAASGYVDYDAQTATFSMNEEQKAVFVDPSSPYLLTGGFYSLASVFADEPRVSEAFRTGRGIDWGEHDGCLFCGVERFFSPSYQKHLVADWLPALEGVVEKLHAGARVADIGCGHGVSTRLMAEAFPNSSFVGFDIHEPSIRHATEAAERSGLSNVSFATATAKSFPGEWDLATCFDCLHDMGDPIGAAAHIYGRLAPGGTWMIVEPMAGDRLEDNFNPVGRAFYAFSTAICTPTSLSQEVGEALGAQAGEKRLRQVLGAGGFRRVRRAAETPFNMILEARK